MLNILNLKIALWLYKRMSCCLGDVLKFLQIKYHDTCKQFSNNNNSNDKKYYIEIVIKQNVI